MTAKDGAPGESKLAERVRELEELVNHLLREREDEKLKLARQLHDGLGSILISAKMDSESVATRLRETHPDLVLRLQRSQSGMEQAVEFKRRIIEDLRPSLLDNLGLATALEWLVSEACRAAGLEYSIVIAEGVPASSPIPIVVFRVVEQALSNVVKFASAKKVSVEVAVDDANISLIVEDDGVGISREERHDRRSFGISGMKQRVRALGGDFSIHAGPQGGTLLEANIPLAGPAQDT
jgi:signal transduction histidine kinase